MFVLNQLVGTLLVNPDWDEMFRIALKYSFLIVSLLTLRYFEDVLLSVDAFRGFNG